MLSNRAMLVSLVIGAWKGEKTDRDASAGLCEAHHAEPNAARAVKRLVPARLFKAINAAQREARDYHYRVTLPWLDSGVRVLPGALWQDYEERMRRAKSDLDAALVVFQQEYEVELGQARHHLGSMYDEADYPDPREIVGRYEFKWSFLPMPESGHFVLDCAKRDLAELKARCEADEKARSADLVRSLAGKVAEVVGEFAGRINPDKARFWDSVADEVRDLAKTVDALNVTESAEIAKIAKELRRLAQVEPQEIRDDERVRKQALAHASELAKQARELSAYL